MGPQEIIPDNDALAAALRQFFLRLHRELERRMVGCGASIAQAKLLQSISSREVTRSTDLATLHDLSPRTITELIDGMERAGLVVRVPDPADRRAKNLTLTPAGVAANVAAEEIRQVFYNDVFDSLDDRERRELGGLLAKLTARPAAP